MDSPESALEFQQYLSILKRRWLPASVVFVSVVMLAVLGMLRQKPIYEAEAKLLFKKTSPTSSITGLGKEIGEFVPVGDQSNPLSTEIEVIKSVTIARKTIDILRLTNEKNLPLNTKNFLKKIKVSNIKGTDMLAISYQDREPKKSADVVNTVINLYIENNQVINRSEAVYARQFIEKQFPNAESSVRQAEVNLRQFKEQNNVVDLQEEAKSAVEVIGELDKKIVEANSQLADADAEVKAFQTELQMTSQQALAATSLSQSSAVQDSLKEYQRIENQLAIERTRFQETHPVITDLKTKESALKALLQERIQQSLNGQSIKGNLQIGEVKSKLIEEFVKIEAKRQGLKNQVASLYHQQAIYKQRVNVIPRLEQKQRELESKLQVTQSTYALLLQKLQEIRIAENQNMGNARIIQTAFVPEEPVASRKSLAIVTGVLLGSMLSIGTALVLEANDKLIRTVEDAKQLFGFSLLGVIPYDKYYKKNTKSKNKYGIRLAERKANDKKENKQTLGVVVKDTPDCRISTAYRMIYANLKFHNLPKDIKTMVVTSSVPGEGKSTICANLAVTIAQLGQQVLLIDADLPDPFQHEIWRIPNQVGLSNLINDRAEMKNAIAEVMVNLKVITSGTTPTNSTALLHSPELSELLDKLSVYYDLVIIDAPCLKVSTDALMLGKMADGILLVTRLEVADFTNANLAKEFLQKTGQNVIGQVVGFPKN